MSSATAKESDDCSLELAILGSGAAFSAVGYNAAYLVDRSLLLDCGAPVTRLMGQMGLDLDELRWVAISHLHGDHVSQLPLLVGARAARYPGAEPLQIIGPPGTAERLDTLGRMAVGSRFWEQVNEVGGHQVDEWVDGQKGTLGPFELQAVEVEHSAQLTCFAFHVERSGISLGYSGDTVLCSAIRRLAGSVDYLLCECTDMKAPAVTHLWREEVEELIRDNPTTRFILTHLSQRLPTRGAILATDGLVLRLRPVAGG